MRGMRGSAFLASAALVAGAAIGYCMAPGAAQEPAAETGKTHAPVAKGNIPDAGEAAKVTALRSRIAELERMLADQKVAAEEATTNAVAAVPRPPEPGRNWGRNWLENIKKSDPARYTQITNNFAQMRRQRAERQQRNLDFLASVDTSRMSKGAKKTHDELQKKLVLREELMNQIHQVHTEEGMSEESRRAVIEQMHENERQIHDLQKEERSNLFEATANALGFEGDDAKDIVATLEEVVDATDDPRWPPRPRSHRH